MKKIIILICFYLFFVLNLFSQTIISIDDLPEVNQMQINVTFDSIQSMTINPGEGGQNIFWDFSSLPVSESIDTVIFINPNTTPNGNQFLQSEIASKQNCYKFHSHITHKDEEICEYKYFNYKNDGLFYNGSDSQKVNIYDIPRNVFPVINYGDSIKNDSRLIYYNNDNIIKVINIQGYSKADAWGTIKTNTGQSDVLRIFTFENVYDSIYTNGIGSLNFKIDSNYYYKWYKKGLSFPVFQINKGLLECSSPYKKIVKYSKILNNISAGIEHSEFLTNKVKLFPNPASISINFDISGINNLFNFSLTILNLSGNQLLKIDNITDTIYKLNTSELSQGIYFYKITNESNNVNGKFVILK